MRIRERQPVYLSLDQVANAYVFELPERAMHRATTNRDHVLSVLGATRQALSTEAAIPPLAGAAIKPGDSAAEQGPTPSELLDKVDRALKWAVDDEARLYREGQIEDLGHGDMYLSQDPVISLVQSAIEEYADTTPPPAGALSVSPADVGDLIDIVKDKLKCLFKHTPDFQWPNSTGDFHFDLGETSKVALVADWGTGSAGAVRVAEQIKSCSPDHVIHLGDIYPSGTRKEARKHFVDVWKAHGPSNAKYWALNGNHEMICKGIGYIEVVLPFCTQPASCFSLGNSHWRLIGLDTAYDEYDLDSRQHAWLKAKLEPDGPKNILLTHHQPFSAVDARPSKHKLGQTIRPFLETNAVHGWFWGHEHGCLIYDVMPNYWNARFRCIGHGGKDIRRPYYTKPKHPAPNVRACLDVARTGDTTLARNGFALLSFAGPRLEVVYMDEEGHQWNQADVW